MKGNIVLGGLNTVYMRRLALYMSGKLGGNIGIIVDENNDVIREDLAILYVGSDEYVADKDKYVILSDDRSENQYQIYMYQSCGQITAKIMDIYTWYFGAVPLGVTSDTKWILVTSDFSQNQLLAHSIGYASELSEEEKVLYVNLCGQSGIRNVLEIAHTTSLSDLIIDIREGADEIGEVYTTSFENLDILAGIDNPASLMDISSSDIKRLMELIEDKRIYDIVIVAIDTLREGNIGILEKCSQVIHLTGRNLLMEAACQEWTEYIMNNWPEIKMQVFDAEQLEAHMYGMELITEWRYKKLWKSGVR